ncbi:MAG: hypothetical protein ACK4S3_10730, partial [Parvibaculum sp.]
MRGATRWLNSDAGTKDEMAKAVSQDTAFSFDAVALRGRRLFGGNTCADGAGNARAAEAAIAV